MLGNLKTKGRQHWIGIFLMLVGLLGMGIYLGLASAGLTPITGAWIYIIPIGLTLLAGIGFWMSLEAASHFPD